MSIERELPALFDELAERRVVDPPPPLRELQPHHGGSGRHATRLVVFGAVAACGALLVGGLALLAVGDSPSPSSVPAATDRVAAPEPSVVGEVDSDGVDSDGVDTGGVDSGRVDSGRVDLVRIEARTAEEGTTEVRLMFDRDVPNTPPELIDDPSSLDSVGLGVATQVSVDDWISVCGDGHSFPPPGNRTVDLFIPVDWFDAAAVIDPPVEPLDHGGAQPAKIIVCEPRNGFVQVSIWGAASGQVDDVDIRFDGSVIAVHIEPDAGIEDELASSTPAVEELPVDSSSGRPIVDPAVCRTVSANETFVRGLSLFARPSNNPVPIQVLANPAEGPAGPFAILQRYFGDDRTATGGDEIVVNGTTFHVTVFDNGNGDVEWDVGDGSFGYIRSRNLTRDELVAIIETIAPRPVDASVPGFDVVADGGGVALVHEAVNTDIAGNVASSECVVTNSGYRYRITSVSGDPIFEYGAVIDRPVPLDVGERGDAVIVVNGIDDVSAPSVSDVVHADPEEWSELLTQPRWPDASTYPLGEGESIEVPLVAADESVEASSLTLRLVRTQGVLNLEIDSSDALLALDAAFWRTDLEPGGGGFSTAGISSARGFRVHDGPHDIPITVAIHVIDGGEFVLQSTGTITLVPSET